MKIALAVLTIIILVAAVLAIKITILDEKDRNRPEVPQPKIQQPPATPPSPTPPTEIPPTTPPVLPPTEGPFYPIGTNTKLGKQALWMHPNKYDDSWVNDESQWDTVASALDVFGFYWVQVNNAKENAFSKPLLKQKGIRINVETGGLRPHQCDGTIFFNTEDSPVYDKLVNGGHPNFIASLDAPFAYTVKDGFWSQCSKLEASGANLATYGCAPQAPNCHNSIEKVADELVEYLALFTKRYPHAEIGWIEPIPLFRFGSYASEKPPIEGTSYPDLKQIIDILTQKIAAYNAANDPDIKLTFFHSDSYLTGMIVPMIQNTYDSWAKHIAISNHLRSKGIRFGILINDYHEAAPTQAAKDKAFHDGVLNYYDCWHAKGGTFDDVMVESWVHDHPSQGVPEEQQYTFTNVMTKLIQRMTDPNYAPKCDTQKLIQDVLNMPTGPPTTFSDR